MTNAYDHPQIDMMPGNGCLTPEICEEWIPILEAAGGEWRLINTGPGWNQLVYEFDHYAHVTSPADVGADDELSDLAPGDDPWDVLKESPQKAQAIFIGGATGKPSVSIELRYTTPDQRPAKIAEALREYAAAL